jgi:cystathionine gamma-synthase
MLTSGQAVSVSLPTWRSNVGYEEGEEWVVSKMKTGYPRQVNSSPQIREPLLIQGPCSFFINKTIEALANAILAQHGTAGERAMLFPSPATAGRCLTFIRTHAPALDANKIRILNFASNESSSLKYASPRVSAVLFPEDTWSVAKQYWQHSGDGVSSRRAEYCHELLKAGILVLQADKKKEDEDLGKFCKGPKRYRKHGSTDLTPTINGNGNKTPSEGADSTQFIEERFGRNLELQFAETAKNAIKRRIAGSLTADVPLEDASKVDQDESRKRAVEGFREDDIYLYPCGMNAIFHAHMTTLAARGSEKSVMFG